MSRATTRAPDRLLVSHVPDSACKIDSSSVADCLTTTPLSTSACEMNNVNHIMISGGLDD